MTSVATRASFVNLPAHDAYDKLDELEIVESVRTSSLHVVKGIDPDGREVLVIIGASDDAVLHTPAASQAS